MKKILAMVFCLVAAASVSFAGEQYSVETGAGVSAFIDAHPNIKNSYVCDSSNSGCTQPSKVIFNDPVLHITFWTHRTQTYYRHYLVTDTAGTVMFYGFFSSSLSGLAYHTFNLQQSLNNGDYVFTMVIAGDLDGILVSDQFHFSVR